MKYMFLRTTRTIETINRDFNEGNCLRILLIREELCGMIRIMLG